MQPQRAKLLVFGTAAAAAALFVVVKREDIRASVSALCEFLSSKPVIETDLVRDGFANNPVVPVAPTPGHTHPSAAGLRTSATNFVRTLAVYVGSDTYVVGMSRSDQRKGMKGSRQWWWAKDVNADNRSDVPAADDIRYLCDVDYYVNMPALLAAEAKPIVLYTVVPEEAVSVGVDDTSFCFDNDGALHSSVTGAGSYEHFLWDYSSDSLLACETFLGVPTRVISYAVERKQVGKHRQLVLLSPIRVFDGIAAILAYCLLDAKPLNRFNPIVSVGENRFVRFDVHTSAGTFVTTARPNTWLCATVEASADASIATVARLGTTNLMLPTTASWVEGNRPAAAVLTEYHRLCGARSPVTVYPVPMAVRSYQFKPHQYDPEARPKISAFMSPIVHEAFAPVFNKAGEEQCVEGRINKLKKPEPRHSPFVDTCIEEFARLVVGGALLEPVCYEIVEEKQTRPAQRASLAKATLSGPWLQSILKCFGKAEAYQNLKDGRNISTYNDSDKLEMSMFALALSEHCKKFPWYGPGKTPIEVAVRVSDICQGAEFGVNQSDYHRMDGTITAKLREVDRSVCMKAFANHRVALNELLKRNVNNTGILPLGTKFKQEQSHGSGCPATSVFQTLRAGFNAYLGYRHVVKPNGSRYSPEEAFAALGIHLGDDGLDADLPVDCLMWASERTGLIVEGNVIQRGFRGVSFLARYYSQEVWQGSLNSMCDVRRQLSKFHTTVRLPDNVSPEQKLVEKSMSYLATDANTPVIGAYCKRVLLLSSYRPRTLLGVGSWWSRFELSAQYPNENVGGWMDVEFGSLFEEFDRTQFEGWLASTSSCAELLRSPLCAEPRSPAPALVDVVVDNDVLAAQATLLEETFADTQSSTSEDVSGTSDTKSESDGKGEAKAKSKSHVRAKKAPGKVQKKSPGAQKKDPKSKI